MIREPCKQIICKFPKQRYVGNLTEIANEFQKNNIIK